MTEGGKGWIDDFGVRGPAPATGPLSWDKSPVANGAHYFLFGRVDPNDPPGVLREKGFGVEFPNYIVDIKKDPETGTYLFDHATSVAHAYSVLYFLILDICLLFCPGAYQEAIQFQCLERGACSIAWF